MICTQNVILLRVFRRKEDTIKTGQDVNEKKEFVLKIKIKIERNR